jgi:hypothetical protein
MTASSKGFASLIKSGTAVILIAAALTSPSASYGQSNQGDSYDDEPAVQSTSNSGPWQNSAGATIGTRDDNSANGAVRQATPALGPGGGTLGRPAAGPTPDATGGPGGNPDVPFDTSMNIMFLAGGIAFAYAIYRRRLKLKPAVAERK